MSDTHEHDGVEARAKVLFEAHSQRIARGADRLFAALLLLQWAGALGVAIWVSPRAWAGELSRVHEHVWTALLLGGWIAVPTSALAILRPGRVATRYAVAIGQMLMGALLIHLTGGRIETHFHVFGSLALLAFYRDWKVVAMGTLIVAADHLLRGVFWPRSAFGIGSARSWRWIEHASWVGFEDIFLIPHCLRGVAEMKEVAHRQAELESTRARVEAIVDARTAELRVAEEKFRAIFENAAEGIFQTTPEGRYLSANPALGRMYGYDSPADLMGDFVDLDRRLYVEPGRRAEFVSQIERCGAIAGFESRVVRRDGREIWIRENARAVRDDAGRLLYYEGNVADVTEQRRAEEDLRQGERRFRSLVEASASIVWSRLPSGQFETEQADWAEFTGQSLAEYVGWGWLDAIHPEDQLRTAQAWSAASAQATVYEIEHRLRRDDGEYRHMLGRAVPLLAGDGTVQEWVGVHADIDAQKKAEAAMRVAKEAAEAASRAKGEFLANMSHEIRTPMNGILGMTELALDTDLTGQQREYLGLVKSSADALLTVINDILDFSKIEAGKLDLDPTPFALRDCVDETLKTLALRAHGKGLELSGRIAPDLPDDVIGDSGRLRQILVNLVGNALKFTERGEVVVSVEADAGETAEDVALHLSVRDTGIGIPKDKLKAIFEPFEQADGSTTRKYGGTGLGLAISMKLVDLMGGRVWVESEPGRGSTFHFTARLARQPHAAKRRGRADPEQLRDLPILVVDDNRTNLRILDEVLASWGAHPTQAESGPAALKALRVAKAEGRPYPVVLLDGMMPDMDGYAVAEWIKADPSLAGTLVVMLTSNDKTGELARCQALGIAARLTKPVRQSELFDVLMSLLPTGEGHAPEHVQTVAAGPQPSPPPRGGLKILLAEDHVVNQKVVTSLLEKRGHAVTVAGDGKQALAARAKAPFDLILMDVQMPEMDGFEAVAAIREDEAMRGLPRMPIVALTAHAMKGDRERCLAGGYDAYVPKPIRSETLLATIAELTSQAQANVAINPAVVASSPRTVFDREAAMDNMGGDEGLFREILGLFLDDCPRLLADLREAIASDDATSMGRAAHTLKGTSGHFAANAVTAAALRLETASRSGSCAGAAADLDALIAALDEFSNALGDLAPATPPWHGDAVPLAREPLSCS